jgi:hypothetical protein
VRITEIPRLLPVGCITPKASKNTQRKHTQCKVSMLYKATKEAVAAIGAWIDTMTDVCSAGASLKPRVGQQKKT